MTAAQFLAATGRPLATGLASRTWTSCCRARCTATASTSWTCASRRSCGSARREPTWVWTSTTCSTPTRRRRTRRCTTRRRTGRDGCSRRPFHHEHLGLLLGRAVQVLIHLLILLLDEQVVHPRRLRILRTDHEQLTAGDVEGADVVASDVVLRRDAIELRRIEQTRQLGRDGSRSRFLSEALTE